MGGATGVVPSTVPQAPLPTAALARITMRKRQRTRLRSHAKSTGFETLSYLNLVERKERSAE
jgi:hypothetical protein